MKNNHSTHLPRRLVATKPREGGNTPKATLTLITLMTLFTVLTAGAQTATDSSFAFGELSRAVIPHSSFAAAAPALAAPEPGVGGSATEPSTVNSEPTIDPGTFQPVLDGLVGKYGWLTTVLLAIGSLRILFKPVMLVVENAVRNDPARLAAIQRFEAGPIYKTIATVLDVGASIKLPLVKPPGPPSAR